MKKLNNERRIKYSCLERGTLLEYVLTDCKKNFRKTFVLCFLVSTSKLALPAASLHFSLQLKDDATITVSDISLIQTILFNEKKKNQTFIT